MFQSLYHPRTILLTGGNIQSDGYISYSHASLADETQYNEGIEIAILSLDFKVQNLPMQRFCCNAEFVSYFINIL